jgi:two-component system, NarL family, sensor kinase
MSAGAHRWVVARPVAQFAVIGLAAVVIVGLATLAASRRVGQREAITDARTTTLIKAKGLVEPLITNTLAAGDPAAVAVVGDVIEHQVVDSSLVRVKIWTETGTIVYSNDHRLQGANYPLGADEINALRQDLIKADVSDLTKPENRDERVFGKLLEVYLPIHSPNGKPLLFEAYYRYSAVSASGNRIWGSFAPVALGSLIVLELLQVPLAWSLAVRLRLRQRERESLLQRALDASDVERRRIASDLHDGVVQDLVGVAFALAGAARDPGVLPGPAGVLDAAAESVRSTITGLRSALVDIYPPDLVEHGLSAALGDLAGDASTNGLAVSFDPSELPDRLSGPVAGLLYGAVRETLRNVTLHADASLATVRAGGDGANVWVEVADDGSGFDPDILEARAAEGHLGLKGLQGVVRDAGGSLRVASEPGGGTTVRVEVPAR